MEDAGQSPSIEQVVADADQADETQDEGQEQEEQSEVSAEDDEDAPPWRKVKHKVKIEGEESEVDYDELVGNFQLKKLSTQRLQEAGEAKRAAEKELEEAKRYRQEAEAELKGFVSKLLERPKDVLVELFKSAGADPYEIAEEIVWEGLQEKKMTPEEREAREIRRERDALKKRYDEEESKKKADEEAKRIREYETMVEDDCLEALKLSGLKPKARIVARIAELYQASLNATKKRPDPQSIAKKVRDWYLQDVGELYTGDDLNVEELIKTGLLPSKLVDAIGKYHIEKAKKKLPSFGASPAASTPPRPAKNQKIRMNDFFKNLGK